MRWFLAAVLWGVRGVVSAGEVFLIPADNPKPVYPRALYLAGIEGKVLCSDLSREAKNYSPNYWVDMSFFFWARSYLAHSITSGLMPRDKRLQLIAKLNRDVPSIIRRCNTHPTSRAVRFFPKQVRELL